MKILHIADINHNRSNGIKTVLDFVIPEQIKIKNDVYLFNIYNNECKLSWEYYIKNVVVFKELLNEISPEIVVFHSIYKLPYFRFAKILNNKKISYLIMPHGGTSMINHNKSYLKKRIADIIYVNNFIKKASALIYLNKFESQQCVFGTIRQAYSIIPNGVILVNSLMKKNKDNILKYIYMSRIDFSQKAVDLLILAWKKFKELYPNETSELHLYGNFSMSMEKNKEHFYKCMEGSKDIYYHGMVVGDKKKEAFLNSDIFVLTSRYEGMPMAILEALSLGLPCIITPNTNMSDIIENNNCGWVCKLNINDIVGAFIKSKEEYLLNEKYYMENAFKSVVPFSWNKIAKQSIEVYKMYIN